MSPSARSLAGHLAAAGRAPEAPGRGEPLLVALSGGLDSCALLHLLRFGSGPSGLDPAHRVTAAHFDHRMRPGSEADARWVRGLCAAWGIDLITGHAVDPPATEDSARDARYAFLEEARRRSGARAIVTAHHADDQAETVLFRMVRGTGLAGLRGIQPVRGGRVWRPLLQARREEILTYARSVGLTWREDPTNACTDYARNAIRHRILPDAVRFVSPAAVPALARLAAAAAHDEEGWESLVPGLLASLDLVRDDDGASVDRAGLARLHPAVRARLIRAVARTLGVEPGGEATLAAVAFVERAASGRSLDLGAGLTLRHDLGRAVFRPDRVRAEARPLVIPGPAAGAGEALLGGRAVRVAWGPVPPPDVACVERFGAAALRFPLTVRGWAPGDRIRTGAGSRKLKKLFLEARIPEPLRHCVPVVSDASGTVLWAVGLARAADADGAADAAGPSHRAAADAAGADSEGSPPRPDAGAARRGRLPEPPGYDYLSIAVL